MNDSIVTPENTKLIAEWMGYKAYMEFFPFSADGENHYITINDEIEYNPITNAEQSREIEKKLFCIGYEIHKLENFWHTYRGGIKYIRAETLELLIYNIALYEAKK